MSSYLDVLSALREQRETLTDTERDSIVKAILAEERRVDVRRAVGRSAEVVRSVFQAWADANGHRCQPHQRYGMTCGAFERLRHRAGDRCEICGCSGEETPCGYLVIDHEQGTSRVRGLLCQRHNSCLGKSESPVQINHKRQRPLTEAEQAYLALPPF